MQRHRAGAKLIYRHVHRNMDSDTRSEILFANVVRKLRRSSLRSLRRGPGAAPIDRTSDVVEISTTVSRGGPWSKCKSAESRSLSSNSVFPPPPGASVTSHVSGHPGRSWMHADVSAGRTACTSSAACSVSFFTFSMRARHAAMEYSDGWYSK